MGKLLQKVRLETRDGSNLFAYEAISKMRTPPDVIMWRSLYFVYRPEMNHAGDDVLIYREASFYSLSF